MISIMGYNEIPRLKPWAMFEYIVDSVSNSSQCRQRKNMV